MKELPKLSRRAWLRLAGESLATIPIWCWAGSLSAAQVAQAQAPASLVVNAARNQGQPDLEIALRASKTEMSILPGLPTQLQTYTAQLLRGPATSIQTISGSYLGPILRIRRGWQVRIHFTNGLDESTVVHWHGVYVPERVDGHPRDALRPGETSVYDFRIINRAGTYWFHPHPMRRTEAQVYSGLAGLFIVSDDDEVQVGLPAGANDIPLVLQDRLFDRDNQLVNESEGIPMGMMEHSLVLDQTLVNGRANFVLPVATRTYRLRLLNGSTSRIYKLAWEDGVSFTVIGTDGGLLTMPVQRSFLVLAPGERLELLADFRGYPVGRQVGLWSWPVDGASGMGGMLGGMGGGMFRRGTAHASKVLTVRVERQEQDGFVLPQWLVPLQGYRAADASNWGSPRTFMIGMHHMAWTINGRTFSLEEAAPDEIVRLGALELWEFANVGLGMGGAPHPMHIHGPQFQVVGRSGSPASIRDGYVDEGWKDTVLVMPGERVWLLLRFSDYTGLFLYHCHNLDHEEVGMMRNYLVVP